MYFHFLLAQIWFLLSASKRFTYYVFISYILKFFTHFLLPISYHFCVFFIIFTNDVFNFSSKFIFIGYQTLTKNSWHGYHQRLELDDFNDRLKRCSTYISD